MAENSGIGWTDHTQNFWWGCNKVSSECGNCYIKDIMRRSGKAPFEGPMRTNSTWGDPQRWDRRAAVAGRRLRVFTCSMSDFFHPGADPWRGEAWDIIRRCTNLDWLILTKRPELIPDRLPPDWGRGFPNVWLGVTCGVRASLDRLVKLKAIPAAVRFVSAEPLLERIDFGPHLEGIDWIITGCERAGAKKRRPMDLDWVRDIDRQCREAGVAHFFKQRYEGTQLVHDGTLDGEVRQDWPAGERGVESEVRDQRVDPPVTPETPVESTFSLSRKPESEKVRKRKGRSSVNLNDQHYGQLQTRVKVIKDRVRGVFHGKSNGAYIYGRPGTSKTYMVRTTLDMLAANYEYSNGHLTPIGLFDLIALNRDRIIVLDDVSSIFNQPIALQILLAALGTPHDGSRTRIVRHKTAKDDRQVPFSGGIIAVSNLPLSGHHAEILAALKSRVYCINYEPSDEEMIALILHIADRGSRTVSPSDCRMVATFLLEECKRREVRPDVRLFLDKSIPDFLQWNEGRTETHWRDLIVSELEQQLVALEHPQRDLSRAEQTEAERRIAADIFMSFPTREERAEQWTARTTRSEKSYYRRVTEAKKEGLIRNQGAAGDED